MKAGLVVSQGAPLELTFVDKVLEKNSPFAFAELKLTGEIPGVLPLLSLPL